MFISCDYEPADATRRIKLLTPKRRRLTKAAERLIYYYELAYRDATPSYGNNGRIHVGMQAGALGARLRELALATGEMPTGVIDVPKSSYGSEAFSIDLDTLLNRGAGRREMIRRNDAAVAAARLRPIP